jgi:DNA-binding response OmpR family regulator
MVKILVIEDEQDVRNNLVDILELSSMKAIAAPNGAVGLEMARQEKPDLIICDVMMPELDGYSLIEQLRQDEATAMIPFIFLTAMANRNDQRQGMELGADDYLTKPFTPTELLKAIDSRLQKQKLVAQRYEAERDRAKQYLRQIEDNENISATQEQVIKRLVEELRNPLSNINMAVQMLEKASSDAERDRYLAVLRKECAKEIEVLKQMDQLQTLLSPSNIQLLRQFQLLK